MKYAIIKRESGFSTRVKVKTLPTCEAKDKFLNKGSNSMRWKDLRNPVKAGTYDEIIYPYELRPVR